MTKIELKIQHIDNLYFNSIYFLDPACPPYPPMAEKAGQILPEPEQAERPKSLRLSFTFD